MIVINYKTYKEGSGKKAILLSSLIRDLAANSGVEIVSCLQAADLRQAARIVGDKTHLPNWQIWAQHVDPVKRGRATGWFPPGLAKEAGAKGTLLNHSEHKLSVGNLGEALARCKKVGLKTLVFADSIKEAKLVAQFKPDFIGYEPPELVGSRTVSVATAKAEIIKKVVAAVKPIRVIAGAGVHSRQDVVVSLKHGAAGVAVATDVVLAEDPKKELIDLIEGF